MSSSHSPCAACKLQRRKCTQECIFSPYFPPDQPQKFANVHKVFGASNVSKILNELSLSNREDAVTSLAYEAEARLRDPVYGCVGVISVLQHRLRHIQSQLVNAKRELAAYIGPSAVLPAAQNGMYMPIPQQYMMNDTSSNPYMGLPSSHHYGRQLMINEPQQQTQSQQPQQNQLYQHHHLHNQHPQFFESQQQAREQQEQQLVMLENGFDADVMVCPSPVAGASFNQMTTPCGTSGLGSFEDHHQHQHHHHHHHHHQLQLQLHPQQLPQHQQGFGNEDGRNVGPSS